MKYLSILLSVLFLASCEMIEDFTGKEPAQEQNGTSDTEGGNTEDGDNTEDGGNTDEGGNTAEGGNTDEGGNNEDGGNTGEGGNEDVDDSWKDEVIDTSNADYLFAGDITGKVIVQELNGLRNDYISLYNNTTGLVLFMDLYSPMGLSYVTPGIYAFGDGSAMTVNREWCYVYFNDNEPLMRFVEGRVKVMVDSKHSSGYPYYNITARFVNEAGEVIAANYDGQLIEQ